MNNLRFLRTALLLQLKLNFALKLSFFIKVGAIVLRQGLFLFMWGFFFNRYHSINGWNFQEMLAMYGVIAFGIGFVEMVFYGIRDLPVLIENNQLDNFLTQPRNILINVALSKGDLSAASEIIYGLLLLLISGYLTSELFILFMILPLSILFVFSLYLYLNTVAFFMKNSQGFVKDLMQNANIVATQPNSAYQGLLKIITMTVLPVSYLSFFPIEFLRTHHFLNLLYAYSGTTVFFISSCWFFYKGLSRYESSSIVFQRY